MRLENLKPKAEIQPDEVAIPEDDIRVAALLDRYVNAVNRDNGRSPEGNRLYEYAKAKLFPPDYKDELARKGIAVSGAHMSGNLKKIEITAMLELGTEKREVCVHYRKGEHLEIRVGEQYAVSPRTYVLADTARFDDVARKVREVSETAFEA
ncbi:hypothetical protein K8R03_00430 [Candidatus Kaiserbacteria bacterium]|nr:hypothetical protein [Candidatus Kaiserbacteria bacterium]